MRFSQASIYEGSFGVLCGCYTVLWGIRASRPEPVKAVSIRARAKHLGFNAKSVGEEFWVLCSLDLPNTQYNISRYQNPKTTSLPNHALQKVSTLGSKVYKWVVVKIRVPFGVP